MEGTSYLKYVEFFDHRDREATLDLVAIFKTLKGDSERLTRAQAE
jgi:hypothetical protein